MRAQQFDIHKSVNGIVNLLADDEGKTYGFGYGPGNSMMFGYKGGDLTLKPGQWAVKNDDGTFSVRDDSPYNEDGTLKAEPEPRPKVSPVDTKLRNARREALEEAAQLADSEGHNWSGAPAHALFDVARKIRNLKDVTDE